MKNSGAGGGGGGGEEGSDANKKKKAGIHYRYRFQVTYYIASFEVRMHNFLSERLYFTILVFEWSVLQTWSWKLNFILVSLKLLLISVDSIHVLTQIMLVEELLLTYITFEVVHSHVNVLKVTL